MAGLAALADLPVRPIHNPSYREGLSTSLSRGIAGLPSAAAVVVMLGDMPWVPASVVRDLIEAFRARGPAAICIPTFGGRRGNPVLWPAAYYPSIQRISGDRGAKPLLSRYGEHVAEVAVDAEGIHRDVDDRQSLPPDVGGGTQGGSSEP